MKWFKAWLWSCWRTFHGHGALDRFFTQYRADMDMLVRTAAASPELTALEGAYIQIKAEAEETGITWDLVHRLEGLMLQAAPASYHTLALSTIRLRFKALAPSELYEDYLKLITPRMDANNQLIVPSLDTRQEGFYLLAQLQRLRVLHSEYSRARRFIFLMMPLVIAIYVGVLCLVAHLMGADPAHAPLSILVFAAGMIGAFFSAATRLSTFTFGNTFTLNYQQVGKFYLNYFANLLFSMTEGGLAAMILWMAIIGKLIEGLIVPEVVFDTHSPHVIGMLGDLFHQGASAVGTAPIDPRTGAGLDGPSMFENFTSAHPSDYRGYGKLFIISLLAGFTERLVPDFLDRSSTPLTSSAAPAKGPLPPLMPATGAGGGAARAG